MASYQYRLVTLQLQGQNQNFNGKLFFPSLSAVGMPSLGGQIRDIPIAGDRAIYKGRTGGEMMWVIDEDDLRMRRFPMNMISVLRYPRFPKEVSANELRR